MVWKWLRSAALGSLLAGVLGLFFGKEGMKKGILAGDLAPPPYGLRLDGFFTDDENDEVTFSFDDVLFDVYDDGTADLYGEISVAEFNNSGGPGAYSSTWDLDVWFDPGSGSNPS